MDARDAIADLALAEGVHQAVLGNYERVASNYDAYARGRLPPEPDVVRTPFEGIGLTHRVGLHLPTEVSPTVSPVTGVPMTPRALAQPELNAWLTEQLPPLADVGCLVDYLDTEGADQSLEVSVAALELQPIDLLFILNDTDEQAMREMDDRLVRFVRSQGACRVDSLPQIRYVDAGAARFSVFELLPLVRTLRALVLRSRPLRATDVTLMNEASTQMDESVVYDPGRLTLGIDAAGAAGTAVAAASTALEEILADLETRRAELLSTADEKIAAVTDALAAAAQFSLPQAGFGFAESVPHAVSSTVIEEVQALLERLDRRRADYEARMAEYSALPVETEEAARIRLLLRAERAISVDVTPPSDTTSADLLSTVLPAKLAHFDARRAAFSGIETTKRTRISDLLGDVGALLPVDVIAEDPFSLEKAGKQVVRFAEDAVNVLMVVGAELARRRTAAIASIDAAATAVLASKAVTNLTEAGRSLFGRDFVLIPRFTLPEEQGGQLAQAMSASKSGVLFDHLSDEFPVDTWLYGVARVRPKMGAWEQLLSLTGAAGRTEPELTALQLPFVDGERWAGLELADGDDLDHDRLLYTAHFSAPYIAGTVQMGLLLDEWTEVIPGKTADTGMVFHHDRPNAEAPQSMLLVTPTAHREGWSWSDLLDALHDTLDMARMRGVEPDHIYTTPYSAFLPATIATAQARQLTIAANLALNNRVVLEDD